MRIGDKLHRRLDVFEHALSLKIGAGKTILLTLPCHVIYIHPEKRFYVVLFQLEGGNIKESYYFGES